MFDIPILNKLIRFLKVDIWKTHIRHLPPIKAFFYKQLKLLLIGIRGFNEDNIRWRASALTLYTMMSIVPVVAMAFGVAKGFGFEKRLERELIEQFPEQEVIVSQVITYARSLLENTEGGLIAGIGVAILFLTVIMVLGNIEESLNDIWGIKKARTLGRKFSDYLSLMLIGPLLFLLSSSATVFIKTQLNRLAEQAMILDFLTTVMFFFFRFTPFVIIWILFTFLYIFMPNTKVNLKSGLWAAILIGTIYQIVQMSYLSLQIGVAKYNAIYGSLAALPLFLIWLQLSWLIVLFGAEISYAHQNFDSYEEQDAGTDDISFSLKKVIALQVSHRVIHAFIQGQKPLTASDLAHELKIPVRLLRAIISDLQNRHILSEVVQPTDETPAYQPGQDPDLIHISTVIEALETIGEDHISQAETKAFEQFKDDLADFRKLMRDAPQNKLLREIELPQSSTVSETRVD